MNLTDDTLETIFKRASAVIEPGFIILSVSYQLFVEGHGKFQYMLAIAKLGENGTEDCPEIIGTASACFPVLPAVGEIERWMRMAQECL